MPSVKPRSTLASRPFGDYFLPLLKQRDTINLARSFMQPRLNHSCDFTNVFASPNVHYPLAKWTAFHMMDYAREQQSPATKFSVINNYLDFYGRARQWWSTGTHNLSRSGQFVPSWAHALMLPVCMFAERRVWELPCQHWPHRGSNCNGQPEQATLDMCWP